MSELKETIAPKPRMPKAVPFIIGNEAAERFSFYGIRSILATFLVAQFFNPTHNPVLTAIAEAKSNEQTHIFVSLAYVMPLVGGIIADWFFGKYLVIFYVSILYSIGNLTLALSTHSLPLFSTGLVIIAVAAGGIKSCVSANVGDQFDKSNQSLMSKVYGWFYFSINAGSVFSTMLIPVLYKSFGPSVAFGVPGLLMLLATLIFWLGRKYYVRVPPSGIKKENYVFIMAYYIMKAFSNRNGKTIWEAVGEKYSAESIDGVKAVNRVLMVFAFVPIFWAMWDQSLSEWVLQATKLNLNIFGKTFLPEQIQTVNPLFLLMMIPIFTYGIYPLVEKLGIKVTPLRKIGAGLFLTGASFIIIALIQTAIDHGGYPSVWWQILAYAILSASEVMVSITGLEYAYTNSPKSMKSTMSAIWLLTVAVGNLFTAFVNSSIASGGIFAKFTGASYFWLFVAILSGFLIVYMLIAKMLPEKNYVLEDAASAG
ncbi:MAG: POT family MFS transporter [Hydrotalea flava]|uniref:POT family MFS transporter n=1 Tax=Hydrotalea TaxID=1004300 RepID=UPI001025B2D4|nr:MULTISPECIES: POT family MFS transporter [Hydrotalea]MBY0348936.1 POT family MFS transporter [Hydrotalea flava]RWZ86405.1 MAG: MFS transporter [Hydrotalea sp. AMD]